MQIHANTCKVKVFIKLDFFLPKFYSLLKKKWVEMQKHYDRGDTRAYPSCNLKMMTLNLKKLNLDILLD